MKILIADDQQIIHNGIKSILSEKYAHFHFDSVYTGNEIIKKIKSDSFQILILDIEIQNVDSFQFTEFLLSKYPNLRIIVFTTNADSIMSVRYLRLGVYAFISKKLNFEDFLNVFDKVVNGNKFYSDEIFNLLLHADKNKMENPLLRFSNRELDVAKLLSKGSNIVKISKLLNLSPSTISTYKSRIYEKLNITNSVEFIEIYNKYSIKENSILN